MIWIVYGLQLYNLNAQNIQSIYKLKWHLSWCLVYTNLLHTWNTSLQATQGQFHQGESFFRDHY